MATQAFCFDDSPVKMGARDVLADMGDSTSEFYLMGREPLGHVNEDVLAAESHRLLAMRKAGSGTKLFKEWMKNVDYHGEDPSHPSTSFWQSQYKKWRLYDFCCDPKELAAHDLLETLLMRLSFYLRNETLLETLKKGDVVFGPFSLNEDGDYDLSYRSVAWYAEELGKDEERRLEREWCEYAMEFANMAYLEELARLGYGNGQLISVEVFGQEVMSYMTNLRSGTSRNAVAHVFSTSVKQIWMKTDRFAKSKNRCLTDLPAQTLDKEYRDNLMSVLDDLIKDHPKSFHGLSNIAQMQAYFLKIVLQKPAHRAAKEKPATLPSMHPPRGRKKLRHQ